MSKVLSVIDHLLHLSQSLTPGMMSSLKRLLHEWKEDGLTLHKYVTTSRLTAYPSLFLHPDPIAYFSVIRTIKFAREELMIAQPHPQGDKVGADNWNSGLINQVGMRGTIVHPKLKISC